MASKISHLPHIKNTKAGNNYYDPMHSSVFEVYFTVPTAIQDKFKEDEAILTEQVVSVSGLDALQKTVQALFRLHERPEALPEFPEDPRRGCITRKPALRIGMSIISAGMCMYRVNGSTSMKIPRAME